MALGGKVYPMTFYRHWGYVIWVPVQSILGSWPAKMSRHCVAKGYQTIFYRALGYVHCVQCGCSVIGRCSASVPLRLQAKWVHATVVQPTLTAATPFSPRNLPACSKTTHPGTAQASHFQLGQLTLTAATLFPLGTCLPAANPHTLTQHRPHTSNWGSSPSQLPPFSP